jgi:hypothetical protein
MHVYNSGSTAGTTLKSAGSIAKTGFPRSGGLRPQSRYNRQKRWFDCQNGLAAFRGPPAAQPAQPKALVRLKKWPRQLMALHPLMQPIGAHC